MKTKSVVLVSLLSVAMTLVSCAKDRTAEDARADQVAEDKAAADAVVGTYQGSLVASGQQIAGLTMYVGDNIVAIAESGSDTTAQQEVVMNGNLELTTPDGTVRTLTFDKGSFLSQTSSFSVEIPVTPSSSSTTSSDASSSGSININGTFGNGTFSGTINADFDPSTFANFNLSLNGGLPSSNEIHKSNTFGGISSDLIYSAKPKFTPSQNKTVRITIKDSESENPTLLFYNFFSTTKNVDVSVETLPSGTSFTFINQPWDITSGAIHVHSSQAGVSTVYQYDLSLDCTTTPGVAPSSLNCTYSDQNGVVFSGLFKAL